jgi:hypothetical protein
MVVILQPVIMHAVAARGAKERFSFGEKATAGRGVKRKKSAAPLWRF